MPPRLPRRERSKWRKWELWARMLSGNFAEMTTSTPFRGSFTYRPLYFPSEGRRAEDFFALKNPTASAGFEPANLGTEGQHATPRPPKPLHNLNKIHTHDSSSRGPCINPNTHFTARQSLASREIKTTMKIYSCPL